MDCERVKEQLASVESRRQNETSKAEIEAHLEGCADCREHCEAVEAVARKLSSWRELPTPEWRRLPLMPRREPRKFAFGSLLPLAASLLLAIFAFSRAELRVEQGGWSLSFASRGAEAPQPVRQESKTVELPDSPIPQTEAQIVASNPGIDPEELQKRIDEAIDRYEQRSNQRMLGMLAAVSKEQQGEMSLLLKEALSQTQAGNERQLQLILNQFNAQRAADLKSLHEQFSVIYQNQDYQAKGLRTLNNMIAKQTSYQQ